MLKISIRKRIAIVLFVLVLLIISLLNVKNIGRRPELLDISNSVVTPGEVITLYGKYFGGEISKGRVFFNDQMVYKDYIKSWSDNSIELVLNDDFKSGMVKIKNMFGESTPYLITSKNDVPVINKNVRNLSVPIISKGEYVDSSYLKITLNGKSFGLRKENSSLKIFTDSGDEIKIHSSSIIEWKDDSITFFLPFGIDNILISIIGKNGKSNEYTLHKNEIPSIVYAKSDSKTYTLKQKVDISNVIALKDSYVDLYVPCVFEDLNQKNIQFSTENGVYDNTTNTYNYSLSFNITGEVASVTLNSKLEISNLETKIRSDLIGRIYDENSPDYTDGFAPTPEISSDNKDIKNTGVWLVRNSNNRYNQAEILINWITKYIKYDSEGSSDSVIAFSNRKATYLGLINITVSMLRSVGIPSRIIKGIIINDEVHNYQWLEFYLPGGGWVPFDLIEYLNNKNYEIGTLINNRIGFSKGITNIPYQSNNYKNDFYALQNSTSNLQGNVESYDAIWHNIEIE